MREKKKKLIKLISRALFFRCDFLYISVDESKPMITRLLFPRKFEELLPGEVERRWLLWKSRLHDVLGFHKLTACHFNACPTARR